MMILNGISKETLQYPVERVVKNLFTKITQHTHTERESVCACEREREIDYSVLV